MYIINLSDCCQIYFLPYNSKRPWKRIGDRQTDKIGSIVCHFWQWLHFVDVWNLKINCRMNICERITQKQHYQCSGLIRSCSDLLQKNNCVLQFLFLRQCLTRPIKMYIIISKQRNTLSHYFLNDISIMSPFICDVKDFLVQ